MQEILDQITPFIPSAQVMIFGPIAIFVVLSALLVAISRNLFQNAASARYHSNGTIATFLLQHPRYFPKH